MLKQIYNLDSDDAILDQLSNGMRNRKIDQKFLYHLGGANMYYEEKRTNDIYNQGTLNNEDFLSFFQGDFISSKDKKTAIVSLGCGNSEMEKYLFENIDTKNIDYFGVDSSNEMLHLSLDNLKDSPVNSKFICADFSTKNFRFELEQMTKNYDNRIFVFFSNTFGNINHTNIIDILGNLLRPNEKIWIDIRIRKGTTVQDDFEISNMIADHLNRKELTDILFKTLNSYGVKKSNGELNMLTTKEPSIGALKFTFSVLFNKKTQIDIKGEKILILPHEKMIVQEIYAYDPSGLINFFKEHDFGFVKKQTKGYRGQFLFKKI